MTKIIKLGIDFDGVIGDTKSLITNIASKHLNIQLDPEDTESYFLRNCFGGMPIEIEKKIIEETLTIKSTKKLKPIKNAIEILSKWQKSTGNLIEIVTSREDPQVLKPFIDKYMINKLDFAIYYGKFNKGQFCKEHKFTHFIDDFIFNLIDLANYGIIPLIFDQPYNRKVNRRFSNLAQRIYSWDHFEALYLQPKKS